jgi:ribose 5-phosphate isomerase B
MQIYLGSDHNGFALKTDLFAYLSRNKYDVQDIGDKQLNPDDDFPQFAAKACLEVLGSNDKDPRAILICGSGQGMCMTANRFQGIRACLGYDAESVSASRNDDDANVLCLPAHHLTQAEAEKLVQKFIDTPYARLPRFTRRINEMDGF